LRSSGAIDTFPSSIYSRVTSRVTFGESISRAATKRIIP